MRTLSEAVRARPALADRLALVPHVARAARVLAASGGEELEAGDVLVDRDGGTVIAAGGQAAADRAEPATLKSPAADGDPVAPPGAGAVRAIGALLHLVVHGVPPGEAAGAAPDAPERLVAIVDRALGRAGGTPYAGPAELAADLERWVDAERPRAAPAPSVARRRALVAAIAAAALLLAGLALAWRRERGLRHRAEAELAAARETRRADALEVARAWADKASAIGGDGFALSAAVYAAAVLGKIPPDDSRPQARALRAAAEGHLLAARLALVGGLAGERDAGGPVGAMAAAPGWFATAAGRGVKLWRAGGEPAGALTGHRGDVHALALADTGALLVAADRSGDLRVWDTASRRPLHELQKGGAAAADLAMAPAARGLVAAAGPAGQISVYQLGAPGARPAVRQLRGGQSDATAVAFSPRGDLLAAGARDGALAVWDPGSGAQVATLAGHTAPVLELAFAPDGRLLASGAGDGTIRLWSIAGRSMTGALVGHRAAVSSLAFSPDGALVVAGAADGTVRAWFAADGGPALALDAHQRGPTFARLAADGRVVTAGADGRLRLWRPGAARVAALPAELDGALALSPDGAAVAGAAADDRVYRFRVDTAAALPALAGHTGPVERIAFSPDGALIATASGDGTARLWRAADGQPLTALVGHRGPVLAAAFSRDGAQVATASADHTVRLWSAQGGQTLGVLDEHADLVADLAFSPDGKQLAGAGWDGLIQIWTMQKRGAAPARRLPGKGRWSSIAFSPDGSRLLAAGERGLLLLRASDGGELLGLLPAAEAPVAARFSPDGALAISAAADGTLRVQSAADGRLLVAVPAEPPLFAVVAGKGAPLLAWGDGPRIRLAPLDLAALRRPAADLARAAEAAAGLELVGFTLAHRRQP